MKNWILLLVLLCNLNVDGQELSELQKEETPKYPYTQEEVETIYTSMRRLKSFDLDTIYFGNNKYYFPMIAISMEKAEVNRINSDTTYLKMIQDSILNCIPIRGVKATTVLYFQSRPYILMDMNKESKRFDYYYVDSVRAKALQRRAEIEAALEKSTISTHTLKEAYMDIGFCGSLSIGFNFYEVVTLDPQQQPYLSRCMVPHHNFQSTVEQIHPIQNHTECLEVPYTSWDFYTKTYNTKAKLLYSKDSYILIEKDLGYVEKESERYSTILLRIF